MVMLREYDDYVCLPPGDLWALFLRNLNLYIHHAGCPTRLIELEALANMGATCLSSESSIDERVHQNVMNRLRQLFNLVRSLPICYARVV